MYAQLKYHRYVKQNIMVGKWKTADTYNPWLARYSITVARHSATDCTGTTFSKKLLSTKMNMAIT
jgi:hypothetical protein